MARKQQSKQAKKASAAGRFALKSEGTTSRGNDPHPPKGVSRESAEFAARFTERYRETLRELSKR